MARVNRFILVSAILSALLSVRAYAHNLHGEDGHYDRSVKPPLLETSQTNQTERKRLARRVTTSSSSARGSLLSAFFEPFKKEVRVRWDGENFYVESNGIPRHRMMVGITSWQQQVPLPQPYSGYNAWQFPLFPRVATSPMSCKSNFFRGAIAIAVNGVPIFNPIKNDGVTDTYLAGELDEYGGHAGRADDYHYHIAPLHLQSYVGKNAPIAFALDGYPIYGMTEPNGMVARNLDKFNGHRDQSGSYHYHSSKAYPYVNGGFYGTVAYRDGQVDPQPRAQPVRPFTRPLPGARVVGFTRDAQGKSTLSYKLGEKLYHVSYTQLKDGRYKFEYVTAGGTKIEYYDPGRAQNSGGPGRRDAQIERRRSQPRPPGGSPDRPGYRDPRRPPRSDRRPPPGDDPNRRPPPR